MNKVYLPMPGDPIPALLSYLHSKLSLNVAFDPTINPMLIPMEIKKLLHCEKIDNVMRTAYWIHRGYGFITIMVPDKNSILKPRIVDILGPGKIMLHSDGFFNNEETRCEFWVTKDTIIVPFTQQNFAELKLNAPEVDALAACILSENTTIGLSKSCMLKLQGKELLKEMERIFHKQVWEHFSQVQLADYCNFSTSYWSKLKNGRSNHRVDL